MAGESMVGEEVEVWKPREGYAIGDSRAPKLV